MTGILKEFAFAIAYLDDIIIFSRTAEEHLSHIKQVFEKLRNVKLHEVQQMPFFHKGNTIFRTHTQHQGHPSITFKKTSHPNHSPPKTPKQTPKQVCTFLGLVGYYRKFIKNFAKIAKPLTLLTCQQVKFDWTPTHHEAFLKLKVSIIEAPILCYPDPNNTVKLNSLLPFSHIPFWKHRENGAPLNRKLTEFIMPLPNGIIVSKELILNNT